MNYIVAPGVRRLRQDLINPSIKAKIIASVCGHYKLTLSVLRHGGNKANIVEARQVMMYLLREEGMHYKPIAEIFGKHEHTTVLHSVRKVRNLISINDEKILEAIKTIKERI
jgi:chromosomal replication initiator protein